MYQDDLMEIERQYTTKVLNLQERKRKYDLRMIWNAIFYLVKTGCQWRMHPLGFPKWQLIYYYYRKWASLSDFDLLLENLLLVFCYPKDGVIYDPYQSYRVIINGVINSSSGNDNTGAHPYCFISVIQNDVEIEQYSFFIETTTTGLLAYWKYDDASIKIKTRYAR